ncbi:MAG TPA: helix-turn-helix domain-containing protein, partial [Nitrospira sp.]
TLREKNDYPMPEDLRNRLIGDISRIKAVLALRRAAYGDAEPGVCGMNNRSWYRPSKVAALVHVSKQTIYNWIESGKIQLLLKGKPLKIPRQEVERLLNQNFLSI